MLPMSLGCYRDPRQTKVSPSEKHKQARQNTILQQMVEEVEIEMHANEARHPSP